MVGTVEMLDKLPQRTAPFVDTTLGAPAAATPAGGTLLDEVVEAMETWDKHPGDYTKIQFDLDR